MREVEYGKLAEGIYCRSIIGSRSLFRGGKTTHVLGDTIDGDLCAIPGCSGLTPDTAITRTRLGTLPVCSVLRRSGQSQVCASIVQTITVDVIDYRTIGNAKDFPVKPHLTPAIHAELKPRNVRRLRFRVSAKYEPEVALDPVDVLFVDKCKPTTRQRDLPYAVSVKEGIAHQTATLAQVRTAEVKPISIDVEDGRISIGRHNYTRQDKRAPSPVDLKVSNNAARLPKQPARLLSNGQITLVDNNFDTTFNCYFNGH